MPIGAKPRALLVDDATFDQHEPIGYHPERPERLIAARAAVAHAGGDLERIAAREASAEVLERVHDARFVEALESLRGKRGMLDPDTFVSEKSIEAAKRAAGGAAEMATRIARKDATSGVALLRPPGHHARPAHAMGFCLINNVAVAAAAARAAGLERVAIVDYDVHHGNGTQEMFWRDPHVLYVSLHQFPFYPGTGALEDVGEGEGRGFTVNVPLAAGGGDAVYRAAFDRVVSPVLEQYAPELVLVSAGFDAATRDPLAEMHVSNRGYGYMTQRLAEQARKSAGGRVALLLEGGYDLPSLEGGLEEALGATLEGRTYDELPSDPDAPDVERAARAASAYWKVS
ncbi:MAG TPA: histone deacetylase [Polyangiaceae bacterium]|jgi:acetoin utilization deacetylase AcuC-like enzyme